MRANRFDRYTSDLVVTVIALLAPVAMVILVGLLVLAGDGAQASTVVVDGGFSSRSLAHDIEIVEDRDRSLNFDTVRAQDRFEPIGARNPGFGFTQTAIWVRVPIVNSTSVARDLVLRQDYPLIDELDAWIEEEGGSFRHIATGDQRPFATRGIAHRDFLFALHVPPGATRTVYLRYATAGALNIGLHLFAQQALLETVSKEQLAYGFYYGGFGVLVFYNLFIFLVVRDRAFFYYLLYAISYGLYFGVHNGLSFEFLWPNSPDWGNRSLIVLLALTLVFGLQFTRQFLDSAQHARKLDKVARVLQVLSLVGLAAAFVLPYAKVIVPMALLTVIVTVHILVLGGVGLLQGYRPARYFMLAWIALLVGVLAYMLKTFGLLPHNALTQNGFQAGALLEMVLLSLALAARVNELQRQSLTDPLTKLANRRFFDRQLELAVAHVDRGSIALLVIDIDHFKQFNDRYGHAMGDTVLTTVGQVLSETSPRGATVCRYGGEEFTVILPATDAAEAERVAEALRAAVANTKVNDVSVTVSIGLACAEDRRMGTAHDFFQAADGVLYEAKRQGRNRVVRYRAGAPATVPAPA